MNDEDKKQLILFLRTQTILPLPECKKALELKNYDVHEAHKYLMDKHPSPYKLINIRKCENEENKH